MIMYSALRCRLRLGGWSGARCRCRVAGAVLFLFDNTLYSVSLRGSLVIAVPVGWPGRRRASLETLVSADSGLRPVCGLPCARRAGGWALPPVARWNFLSASRVVFSVDRTRSLPRGPTLRLHVHGSIIVRFERLQKLRGRIKCDRLRVPACVKPGAPPILHAPRGRIPHRHTLHFA